MLSMRWSVITAFSTSYVRNFNCEFFFYSHNHSPLSYAAKCKPYLYVSIIQVKRGIIEPAEEHVQKRGAAGGVHNVKVKIIKFSKYNTIQVQ